MIAIDGVTGNETLYLIRELQTGRVLVPRNLQSEAEAEARRVAA